MTLSTETYSYSADDFLDAYGIARGPAIEDIPAPQTAPDDQRIHTGDRQTGRLADLSHDQAAYTDWWYGQLSDRRWGIRPAEVTPLSQQGFTLRTHYLIADYVASFSPYVRGNTLFRREQVDANIRAYYQLFPPTKTPTPYLENSRHTYQDYMMAAVRDEWPHSLELKVATTVLRALYDHRNQHPDATPSGFALVTAYGMTIRGLGA